MQIKRHFSMGSKAVQTFCCIAAGLFSASASADLLNISTTTLQSATQEAIACTIIASGGPTYEGYKVIVGYSESNAEGSNSKIRVKSLRNNITFENDDWNGPQYLNGQVVGTGSDFSNMYTATLGRTPGRSTDSAIVLLFSPGDAICAYSKEVASTSLSSVSISLTDVTASVVQTKNLSTSESFLIRKLIPTN